MCQQLCAGCVRSFTGFVSSHLAQKVKLASPGKSVWLGETSSAYGGGAAGLSDTFVAGFMWVPQVCPALVFSLNIMNVMLYSVRPETESHHEGIQAWAQKPFPHSLLDLWTSLVFFRLILRFLICWMCFSVEEHCCSHYLWKTLKYLWVAAELSPCWESVQVAG